MGRWHPATVQNCTGRTDDDGDSELMDSKTKALLRRYWTGWQEIVDANDPMLSVSVIRVGTSSYSVPMR